MVTNLKRPHHYGYTLRDMTLGRILADKARAAPDRVFLEYLADGRRYALGQIDELSNRVANGLTALGVTRGQFVAVMMDNCPEQMLSYFGLARIGAVAVPLNTAARGKLLAYFLEQCDAVAVLCERQYAPRVREVLDQTPALRHLVIVDADGAPANGAAQGAIAESGFDQLLAADATPPATEVSYRDLCMVTYTSGTTGPSKGNMLVHAAWIQWSMSSCEAHGYRPGDVVYICLPLNHSSGWLSLWAALLGDGAVALSPRFSVSRYWHEIADCGTTITNLLGSMPNMLWSRPPQPEVEARLRVRSCMMVPVPKFALAWEKRFGMRVTSSYGLTDYVHAGVFTVLDPVAKLGSAGRPRPGMEIRVVDQDDLDVPPNTPGEVLLRCTMPWATAHGYLKMPQASLEARRNDWFHTGDIGYLDADGFLFFTDRKKDALRRRGENISAFEVESLLMDHPAVAEAACYPLKAEDSEDEVAVSLLLVAGRTVTERELIEYCIANMAHYMVPRFLHLTHEPSELPRTESHKIIKRELREWAEAHRDRLWDRDQAGIVVRR